MSEEINATFDAGVVLQLILVVLALIGHAVFVFRYFAQQNDKLREDHRENVDDLHNRINTVRDEYVKRVELDRELDRIHNSISDMRSESREGMREVGHRLDALQDSITSSVGKLAAALATKQGGDGG